jgi:uncharacterized protein (DUF2164 family)
MGPTVITPKDDEATLDDKIVESAKTIRDELLKRLPAYVRKELEIEVDKLLGHYDAKMTELKSFYEQGLKNLEAIVKSLAKPNVTVTLPPRKTTVTKSIVYGQTGRPDKIVEETEER